MPPPSTGVPLAPSQTPVSENTKQAIAAIHSLLARSTTYNEHYTPRSSHTQSRPASRPDHSLSSRLSLRPWTAESRGKYSHCAPDDSFYYPYLEYAYTPRQDTSPTTVSKVAQDSEQGRKECGTIEEEEDTVAAEEGNEGEDRQEEEEEQEVKQKVEMSDAATQTDEAYFKQHSDVYPSPPPPDAAQQQQQQRPHTVHVSAIQTSPPSTSSPTHTRKPIDALTAKLYKLPLIDSPPLKTKRTTATQMPVSPARSPPAIQLSKKVGTLASSFDKFNTQQPSVSQKLYSLSKASREDSRLGKCCDAASKPRSVESTRRMIQVFNGYSKAKTLKRFTQQYQDPVPDLRHFSIREGKRHFIHGTHAYYYH